MTTRTTVLIVEDDVILGWALDTALYKAGYGRVILVGSVEQALQQLRYGLPDVALLDLWLQRGELSLPVADALDDLGVPLVFLTGHSRGIVTERHRKRAYLIKPASEDEILAALRSAMTALPSIPAVAA
jgi:DNA-binding NtrC family response regulator